MYEYKIMALHLQSFLTLNLYRDENDKTQHKIRSKLEEEFRT
jgi:hypothetical protein